MGKVERSTGFAEARGGDRRASGDEAGRGRSAVSTPASLEAPRVEAVGGLIAGALGIQGLKTPPPEDEQRAPLVSVRHRSMARSGR